MTPFEHWWYHEGSGPPTAGNDLEEHCKRMCQIAWNNGAFKEREEFCADLRFLHDSYSLQSDPASLKARGEKQ